MQIIKCICYFLSCCSRDLDHHVEDDMTKEMIHRTSEEQRETGLPMKLSIVGTASNSALARSTENQIFVPVRSIMSPVTHGNHLREEFPGSPVVCTSPRRSISPASSAGMPRVDSAALTIVSPSTIGATEPYVSSRSSVDSCNFSSVKSYDDFFNSGPFVRVDNDGLVAELELSNRE